MLSEVDWSQFQFQTSMAKDKPEETPEMYPDSDSEEPTSGHFMTCYICAKRFDNVPETHIHRQKHRYATLSPPKNHFYILSFCVPCAVQFGVDAPAIS